MDMGTRPYALAREEGRAVWFLGTLVIVKATGEQTGGAFGLVDNLLPAGFASPTTCTATRTNLTLVALAISSPYILIFQL
jgi:hypothetical protein